MAVPVIEQDRPYPGQPLHQLDERCVKRALCQPLLEDLAQGERKEADGDVSADPLLGSVVDRT